jgi:hypothetical protein
MLHFSCVDRRIEGRRGGNPEATPLLRTDCLPPHASEPVDRRQSRRPAGSAPRFFSSAVDGNGRLGRLLITLLLCSKGALREPLLYLSLYFKSNRDRYYELLQRVRTHGAWEEWLAFFLEGAEITARSAAEAAKRILTLFAKDRDRIQTIGRAATSALRVHEHMQKKPLVGIGTVAEELKLSVPTVTVALYHLVRLGIAKEVTGKRRARIFGYSRYLKILSEGTDPLKQ